MALGKEERMSEWEAVVIGGGPAGLGAAIEIAHAGARVLLIDENRIAGGQLFKQIHKFFGSRAHNAGTRGYVIAQNLLSELEKSGVEVWLDSAVVGVFPDNHIMVRRNMGETQTTVNISAKKILLATGASENVIRFPGWTIPGVMGAGAAQTMINVNRVLPGKRVLMVGSGNVGLIVSYQLMQAGADVVGIVEAAPCIGGYGVHASKVRRAGVEFYLGHSVVRAEAKDERVCKAVIAQLDDKFEFIPGTEKEFEIDTLCLAVGLKPLTELAYLSGARLIFVPELSGWLPAHDKNMMTSEDGIYVAGDITGVEEANTALDEGRLAGIAIAESLGYLPKSQAKSNKDIVTQRLKALRQGPFGLKRASAKENIINFSDHQKKGDAEDESMYVSRWRV
jgi:thioredoxin reductase